MVPATEEIKGTGYRVNLENFEGPLDLLLYLIKRDEIDIYDIPIARVTSQYLEHVRHMESLDLEIAGEFLLMAATLMRIKSKMLLPRQLDDDGEEEEGDPRDELVQRLLEYRGYKRIAEQLSEKADLRKQLVGRQSPPYEQGDEEEPELLIPVDLVGLLRTFTTLLENAPRMEPYEVMLEEYTLEEKNELILHWIEKNERVEFTTLFPAKATRSEIVATFISMLELLRLQRITISQTDTFGRIWIRRREGGDEHGDEREYGAEYGADEGYADGGTAGDGGGPDDGRDDGRVRRRSDGGGVEREFEAEEEAKVEAENGNDRG
ncbi:MAG: segregation/condensation protein A [Gemmatimonadetes bacterium]|nr:segregation/condensation protein A [Gemmatimonadota bacterium]